MIELDIQTLLSLALLMYIVMAVLTLMAAVYGSRDRTLLCLSAAWFLAGGTGALINLAHYGPYWLTLTMWVTNATMLATNGLLWAGLRFFSRKRVPWIVVFGGAIAWLLLCLWPAFTHSVTLRVTTFSAIVILYMGVCVRDLWPERRADRLAITPVMGLLVLNGLFYGFRLLPLHASANSWLLRPDSNLTVLENIVFVLGISFSILVMIRAQTERHYLHVSMHDHLTDLYNRRAFFSQGLGLVAHHGRHDRDVAAIMCDLDWFKHVNDRFGHDAGDMVLTVFAQILRDVTPEDGICARIGGEEFFLLTPDPARNAARPLAERLQRELRNRTDALPEAQTVSIGVAFARNADYDLDRLVVHADQALYAAKDAGRNCIVNWSQAMSTNPTFNGRARTSPRNAEQTDDDAPGTRDKPQAHLAVSLPLNRKYPPS